MADFFAGLGVMPYFTEIFLFVFVAVFMYAMFRWTELFKGTPFIHGILAFIIALLIAMTPITIQIIKKLIPPFVVLFIFIILVLIGFMLFGVTNADIAATIKSPGAAAIKWGIFIAGAIIVVGVIANVFGQQALNVTTNGDNTTTSSTSSDRATDSASFSKNLSATFFHPKVLGFIAVMLVAVATIGLMAAESRK